MPSGSHRSRGGSHRSGGARRSGSSSRSSSSRSGGYSRSRTTVFWGRSRRRYYGPHGHFTSARSAFTAFLGFLAILSLVFAFIGFQVRSEYKAELNQIQVNYDYYQLMIADTDVYPDRIRQANVTGRFLGDYNDQWYIVYQLPTDTGEVLEGETYSVYTMQEAAAIMNQVIIEVAVDSSFVTLDTDSIPMDYKDIPITRDGEYMIAKNNYDTWSMIAMGSAGAGAFLLFLVIVLSLTGKKNATKQSVSDTPAQPAAAAAPAAKYCAYCGGKVTDNDRRCPSCGASVQ